MSQVESATLSTLDALLLGIVQGLTEFLPVSSSGHLALTQHWLEIDPELPVMLLFNVLAHVGTLLAVVWVFRAQCARFLKRLTIEIGGKGIKRRYAIHQSMLALVTTVTTAAIGLPFQDQFESAFGSLTAIGGFLMVTGLALIGTRAVVPGKIGWRRMGWSRAVLIGMAQALAIFPGVSRSGATICAALYLGCRRRVAAEYSFLIAIPAICGGTAKKLLDTFRLPAETLTDVSWTAMVLGTASSMLVGVFALRWLLSSARRGRLDRFAWYCLPVGGAILLGSLVLAD